uniref:Putative nitrogen fixation protein fixH n=1 Tax=Magnetococcus massalia (strain MO-1) TaxID=451514 RepID=A0A1S7LJC9_MAGMO|nr:putative nitrogen fixation protein fixH [Candidatus Magnetococcus massalia]
MEAQEQKKPFMHGGGPWLIAFILFFVIVIGVNSFVIYMAKSTSGGLVIEGHYKKGMAYNEEIEQMRQQQALGWQIGVDTSALRVGQEGLVFVQLLDKAGMPIRGATIRGELFRPTSSDDDIAFNLVETAAGKYQGLVKPHLKGKWDVRLKITQQKHLFRHAERVEIAQ